ncbi:unnamed protein product [Ixodes hexagonus]
MANHCREMTSSPSLISVSEAMNVSALQARPKSRICIVGSLKNDSELVQAAKCHGLPVVFSDTGDEFHGDKGTIFVLDSFEGETFEKLKVHSLILSPIALMQCTNRLLPLPDKGRPVYNLSMDGVVLVFTGFRSKQELCDLLLLCHYMGASVRDKFSKTNVTHCVADCVISDKYELSTAFEIPIMRKEWLLEAWKHRDEPDFSATNETMMQMRIETLRKCKVAFLGFSEDEQKHMEEVAIANGAIVVPTSNPSLHFLVVDDSNPVPPVLPPALSATTSVVRSEWFWASIQDARCLTGKRYLYEHPQEPMPSQLQASFCSPASAKGMSSKSESKRRRIKESMAHQLAQEVACANVNPFSPESPRHKRRLSTCNNRSISILDVTLSPEKSIHGVETLFEGQENGDLPGMDLTCMSKRQQVCWELLQTETNYVAILHTILTLFKAPLENPDTPGEPLLDPTEIKIIFGNLPPIYQVHRSLQLRLQSMLRSWTDDHSIGEAILHHREEFEKAYPPFVNFFEKTKETLVQCDVERPRFHAFLKRCQTKPECGRQTLVELLIRPVQRLGSVILLLKEIQKRTPKENKDSQQLDKAIAALNQVMLNINEGKRKTESQVAMFDIFNDIENCPPNILSGHRFFVTSMDAVEVGDSCLSKKGDTLVLFLFSDVLEFSRRRTKAAPSTKSPANPTSSLARSYKGHKHLCLVSLFDIKRVVDLTTVDDNVDVKNAFGLVLRLPDETRENLYTFVALTEQPTAKLDFLRTLCRHMAKVYNTPDSESFLTTMRSCDLGLDSSAQSTTIGKALRYAAKKGEKLSRALSITRKTVTPRRTLSRAMSTFISPLRSMTNQSSPHRGMHMASSSNLNDSDGDSVCSSIAASVPDITVIKSHSYGASSSKYL